ncbi:MAG: phosphatase PAP2 family protein [Ignavibacteriaceae bacterium]
MKTDKNLNSKNTNILIIYLLIIWTTLAAYFAFTDLQISLSVVNQNSGWAIFLQDFGEIPGLLVLFCSAHIYLAKYSSESRLRKIVFSIILFIAASFLSGYLVIVIYKGIIGSNSFLQEFKIAIILVLLILNFILNILIRDLRIPNSLKEFSKTSVLLSVYGYLCLIQPIKLLWGRVRFRDLDALYANFTPWFLPNGLNGNQSFPSGHAAMAWMILPLLLLVVNKSKTIKISLLILIIFWGLTVSLNRVVIGAHYASDALFGAFIIVIIFLLLIKYSQNSSTLVEK